MPKQNEREIALNILSDIFEMDAYSNIILKRTFEKNNLLTQVQKSFITEIVNGTLRNLLQVDYIINLFSSVKTKKMKPFILNLLRISVYQSRFMERVPDSAICNEAVKLAKARGFNNLSAFVNGVLRGIIRGQNEIAWPDKEKNPLEYLSVLYSFPEWMLKYWCTKFSYAELEEICRCQSKAPLVSVCVNILKTNKESLKEELLCEGQNVAFEEGNILCLSKPSDITKLKAFQEGKFHVMDLSSAKAVELLAPKAGDIVADVCAAPGGKSFYAAYLMKNEGRIFARDIYEHKLELIEYSAERLGIQILETGINDAALPDPEVSEADLLLLDAPCSGLGIIRKKPDMKYKKTYQDIVDLQALQRRLLAACRDKLKVGGVLLYSTCTISELENMDNVKWFIQNYPFELAESKEILPSEYADGFFMAKLIRKA